MTGNLNDWIERIQREHRSRNPPELHGVAALVDRLGLTRAVGKTCIVAGTNGKGSTVRYLEGLLLASGRSVGATASPHLNEYNERIRLNGQPASDEEIVSAFELIDDVRNGQPLTYFEWATIAGLELFRRHRVEVTLLEVGLGGRFDAANIVDRDLTVITSIGIDHSEILGEDRETIGNEKAGILRSGIPLVYSDKIPVRSVLERSQELDCPRYLLREQFSHCVLNEAWNASVSTQTGRTNYSFPRIPAIRDSAAAALQAAVLLADSAVDTVGVDIAAYDMPGRLESFKYRDRTWMLDVAHNPDAARFAIQEVRKRWNADCVHLLFGCMSNKDVAGILRAFELANDRITITDTSGKRGVKADLLAVSLEMYGMNVAPELASAIDYAVETTSPSDVVLVAGSFQLVNRVRQVLTSALEAEVP